MSHLKEAADAIRRQLKTLDSWKVAADALDRLGSLEQAEREANDRIGHAQKRAAEADEHLAQVEKDIATAQAEQMTTLEQTRERAARIIAGAETSAAVAVADGQARAAALIADAEERAAQASSHAQQVTAEAAIAVQAARIAASSAENVLVERRAQLAEVESKIANARGRIAELLK